MRANAIAAARMVGAATVTKSHQVESNMTRFLLGKDRMVNA
jgi:hypothetical protein